MDEDSRTLIKKCSELDEMIEREQQLKDSLEKAQAGMSCHYQHLLLLLPTSLTVLFLLCLPFLFFLSHALLLTDNELVSIDWKDRNELLQAEYDNLEHQYQEMNNSVRELKNQLAEATAMIGTLEDRVSETKRRRREESP